MGHIWITDNQLKQLLDVIFSSKSLFLAIRKDIDYRVSWSCSKVIRVDKKRYWQIHKKLP